MNNSLISILSNYLEIFPEEQERQQTLKKYLEMHTYSESTDWNNFEGHIVAGGFIYAIKEQQFLMLYHKDLQMYLYPGGHSDKEDENPLETAIRETQEETGLINLKLIELSNQKSTPIDIDTHIIEYNSRINLPEHYHFDFRYLFTIDKIEDISLDTDELSSYKWVSIDELHNDPNYEKITAKIKRLLSLQ